MDHKEEVGLVRQVSVHYGVKNVFGVVYESMADWKVGEDQKQLVHPQALQLEIVLVLEVDYWKNQHWRPKLHNSEQPQLSQKMNRYFPMFLLSYIKNKLNQVRNHIYDNDKKIKNQCLQCIRTLKKFESQT